MKQLAVLFLGVLSIGCAKNTPLPGISDTAQKVQTETTGDAVNRVAGDKELLRQALVLADSKGTLEPALTEAAQDSIVGIRMREALVLGSEAKQKTTAPPAPIEGRRPKGQLHHTGGGEKNTGAIKDTGGK